MALTASRFLDPKSDVVFKKIFGHHADLLKGMAKGREEGMARGRKEGERDKALVVARNLKEIGLSVDQISKATGLSVREVQNLGQ